MDSSRIWRAFKACLLFEKVILYQADAGIRNPQSALRYFQGDQHAKLSAEPIINIISHDRFTCLMCRVILLAVITHPQAIR